MKLLGEFLGFAFFAVAWYMRWFEKDMLEAIWYLVFSVLIYMHVKTW